MLRELSRESKVQRYLRSAQRQPQEMNGNIIPKYVLHGTLPSQVLQNSTQLLQHLLELCMHAKSLQSCPTLCNPMDCSLTGSPVHGILRPWDPPGKNTRVGCHFLLQGIFPTQGSNPGLLHCRQILYHLSYEENLLLNISMFQMGLPWWLSK